MIIQYIMVFLVVRTLSDNLLVSVSVVYDYLYCAFCFVHVYISFFFGTTRCHRVWKIFVQYVVDLHYEMDICMYLLYLQV